MTRGVAGSGVALCGAARRQDGAGERVPAGTGEPCERPAGWGTSTPGVGPCKLHGGTLPAVERATQERAVLVEAQRGLARLGVAEPLESIEQAYDLLLSVAGQLEALRQGLQDEVQRLTSVRYEHDRVGEQVRGEVTVLLATTKELTSLLATIGKLDVAGRRVRLDEARTAFMVRFIEEYVRRRGEDPSDTDVRGELHAIWTDLEGGQ